MDYKKCTHCHRKVLYDYEGDLVHLHYIDMGVDERMCEPNNPDSKIAELERLQDEM